MWRIRFTPNAESLEGMSSIAWENGDGTCSYHEVKPYSVISRHGYPTKEAAEKAIPELKSKGDLSEYSVEEY